VATDELATLLRYLQVGRDALLWKLEGLSEYDVRRPLTPTGTNLLGVVKHVSSVEAGYLGGVFGRPFPEEFPWFADDAEPNDDMWARADETRAEIVDRYHRVWVHSDHTVADLPLDALGEVPWWRPESRVVTLHQILVHITTETHRHAGHADIVRELVDGAVGLRVEAPNVPDGDAQWWSEYRQRLEQVARDASIGPTER
jgi:uncharacterized damage-inducible protein DinB